MHKLLLFVFVLLGFSLSAQILEEKAAFTDKPRGEEVFNLIQGEHIYTYQGDDGWYKSRKMVYLLASDIDGKKLRAGASLYNEDEEKIGETKAELKLYDLDTIESYRGDNSYRAVIQGYIFDTKLEDGSLPEAKIEEIMSIKNRGQQQQMFAELWADNDAENEEHGEFNVWVIHEHDKTTQKEKDFRLIMVFRGKATPYAVITNGHEISLPKIKEEWEDADFRVYYLFKASAKQKTAIEDLIYNYLAL